MAKLSLLNITKRYQGEVIALDDISIDINSGEFIAILGPSGCGKSTLLRLIAGLEFPDGGDIQVDGKSIIALPPQKRNVAMMFQNYVLFPHMRVSENLEFGLKVRKIPASDRTVQIHSVAEILGLTDLLARLPHELSGGQRQRVALGRAILHKPDVYLLDEPLSNLDAKMRQQMRYEISELHKKLSATMLFVTHDQTEAMTLGTKIIVLNKGKIQQTATPQALYHKPQNTFVATFIGTPPMNIFTLDDLKNYLQKKDIPTGPEAGVFQRNVAIGLRPEHLSLLGSEPSEKNTGQISALLKSTEYLGAHSILHCQTLESKTNFVVQSVDVSATMKVNEKYTFTFQAQHLHYFDPATKQRIPTQ